MSSRNPKPETSSRRAVITVRPPPEEPPIRVVVAESSRVIREFLVLTLAAEESIALVADCANALELDAALAAGGTDVLVIDVRLPPSNGDEGIRIARRLRETHPQIGVVLLSQYAEPADVLSLLESGSARAYLLKDGLSNRHNLIVAVRTVARGGIVVDPEIVDALIEARARVARSPLPRLSRAERELLAVIVEGKDDAAIAISLAVPERTVGLRVKAILERLELPQTGDSCRRVQDALAYLAEEGG
jgi:DNA-binding NarL/FixJ family response regulator